MSKGTETKGTQTMSDDDIVECMKRVLFLEKDELVRRVGKAYFNSLGIPNYAFQNEHVIRVMVRQARRMMALTGARGKHVLEIGCGIGFNSIITALAGARKVTALDYIPAQIEVMRRMVEIINEPVLFANLTILCGDVTKIDFPESTVDVIEIVDVLSHCQDFDALVTTVKKVSRNGARLYILDGNNALRLGAAKEMSRFQQLAERGPIEAAHATGKCIGIAVPYVQTRARMIRERFPHLDDAMVGTLADRTAGLYGEQIFQSVEVSLSGKDVPAEKPSFPDVCVTMPTYRNPENGMWPEVAFSPIKLRNYLCRNGIAVDLIRYRHTVFTGGIQGLMKRVLARVLEALYPASIWLVPGFELLGRIDKSSKQPAS